MQSESLAREVCELLVTRLSTQPQAIVLTGSFARNEGSVLITGNRTRVLGDMECMVIFSSDADRSPLQVALNEHADALRAELASRGIECDLEFRAVNKEYFYALTPQIFGYELLKHGRTIWGDPSILAAVPPLSINSVPRWDAWRMLHNRIIEQLYWCDRINACNREQLDKIYYQLIKCHIDLATTLLVFAGRYEDTYAARAKALSKWAFETNSNPNMKFLHFVAQRIAACTAFKLDPGAGVAPLGVPVDGDEVDAYRENLRQALVDFVPLVHDIWRWEAAAFAENHRNGKDADENLQQAVLENQPFREKFRGWAKLALMPEVRRQEGFLGRSLRLGLQGSPRYLVYSVAAQLYFRLPTILAEGVAGDAVLPLERQLPVIFEENKGEKRPWWRLRANVLSSWDTFLRNHFA